MLVSSNPAFLAYLGPPISHIGQNPKNARFVFSINLDFSQFSLFPPVWGWPFMGNLHKLETA